MGNKIEVPFFDLRLQYETIRDEVRTALDRACHSASFILGEEVEQFEQEFAAYCEARYCVALNSGTSALHLALLSADVAAGDEVITTANTFVATAEAISYTGARPVFVDIDPETANIDPERIESAITSRTKVIVPVHLYGRPADLDPILRIASRHNLIVIEDACQAHGARYRGRRIGNFGHAAAFSFYPGKNLGAYGEGGALVTNSEHVARFARSLRDHGQVRRYFHEQVGYNYRMDGFQGAVLRVKLKRLAEWTCRRQELARIYRNTLEGTRVEFPKDNADTESVYHLFVAYVDQRESAQARLEKGGVHTAIHYPRPVHLQRAYAALGYEAGSLPFTERACERVLSMPLFPEMTTEQAVYAASLLAEITDGRPTAVLPYHEASA